MDIKIQTIVLGDASKLVMGGGGNKNELGKQRRSDTKKDGPKK